MTWRERYRRHQYGWLTLILFAGSMVAHLVLTLWNGEGVAQWLQTVAENWQSEFLQLLWQVCGLAWFLQVGSPASKESSERLEAKVDILLERITGDSRQRQAIDRHWLRER